MISYPSVNQVLHLGCNRIRESDLVFESHLSGYVYKVIADGRTLIKKEIPSHDTIDEFLYEINALNSLSYSNSVIQFYGVVVDEYDQNIKGLLINYANGGALIDIIYDNCKESMSGLPWEMKERWARQIVQGLADIHESGFVQGDFTLSNIVIDENDDAKIIDINRRGCPVGWEPPEATALLSSGTRISMYIGVKSDLYQLGMVLWALAMEEDEPEHTERPLFLGQDARAPNWYRNITETCLNPDPRKRVSAAQLLERFPEEEQDDLRINIDDGYSVRSYDVDDLAQNYPQIHPSTWSQNSFPSRGRSLPSPLPSVDGRSQSPPWWHDNSGWTTSRNIRPSYSDVGTEDADHPPANNRTQTPTGQNQMPCEEEQLTPRAHGQMSMEMGGLDGMLAPEQMPSSRPIPRSVATKESIVSLKAGSLRSARDEGSVFDDMPATRVGSYTQPQADDVVISNVKSGGASAKVPVMGDHGEPTQSDTTCLVMDANGDWAEDVDGGEARNTRTGREPLAEVSPNVQRTTGRGPESDTDSIPLSDVFIFGSRGGGEVNLDWRSNSPLKRDASSTMAPKDSQLQDTQNRVSGPIESTEISSSEPVAEIEAQPETATKTPTKVSSTSNANKEEVGPQSDDEKVLDGATYSSASTTPTKKDAPTREVQTHVHAIMPTAEAQDEMRQSFWPHDPHHRPETPPNMYRTAPTSPIRSLDGMQSIDFIQPLDLTPLRDMAVAKSITSPILSASTMSPGDAHWTTGPQASGDSKALPAGYASTPRLADPCGSHTNLADSLMGIGACWMPGQFDQHLYLDDDLHDDDNDNLLPPANLHTITTDSRA